MDTLDPVWVASLPTIVTDSPIFTLIPNLLNVAALCAGVLYMHRSLLTKSTQSGWSSRSFSSSSSSLGLSRRNTVLVSPKCLWLLSGHLQDRLRHAHQPRR